MKEKENIILRSIKSLLELGNVALYTDQINLLLKNVEDSELKSTIIEQIKRRNIGKAIEGIDEFLYKHSNNLFNYNSLDITAFSFDKLENITIADIKKEIGVEKLNLNTDKYNSDIYRHWNHHGRFQVCISKDLAAIIKENKEVLLRIKKDIKVSQRGYYTSFSIVGNDEYFEDEISKNNDNYNDSYYYEEDNYSRFEKYNGIYGLDDNTIDDAFDGDPENYWNID